MLYEVELQMSAFSLFHSLAALGIKEFFKYSDLVESVLTHTFPMPPFFIPGKYQRTIRFPDLFRGQRNGALGTNVLSELLGGGNFPLTEINYKCRLVD